jgi:NAD(P)-dependent dehydrogenase (short-subunit alcohol dehydrogenase family)
MATGLKIKGRTALVTGANRGIGLALVEALLERGARKIYGGTRKPEALAELAGSSDGLVIPLRLDITKDTDVRQAAQQADDVDLLINNAAIVGHAPFAGFEDPSWPDAAGREYETNVVGSLRVSQAFAPVLARQGGGALAKAALHSLTQSTREALHGQGTYVVGVYPGPVETDMSRDLTFPKASAASVAHAILDGLEQGLQDIYPDPLAREYGAAYAVSPKSLEGRMAAANAAVD